MFEQEREAERAQKDFILLAASRKELIEEQEPLKYTLENKRSKTNEDKL